MKSIQILSLLLVASAAAQIAQVEAASLHCEKKSCALDLQFATAKSNPTISQSLQKDQLHLTLGKTQVKLSSQTFKNGPLTSVKVESLNADRFDLVLESKNGFSSSFKKIERLDDKKVRFWFDLKQGDGLWQTELAHGTPAPRSVSSRSVGESADQAFFQKFSQEQLKQKNQMSIAQSFTLQKSSRPMVFIGDAVVYEMADMKSKALAQASFGKRVDRIELKAEWVKIRAKSGLTGYVLRNKIAYEDELTPAQIKQANAMNAKQRTELSQPQMAQTAKDTALVVRMADPEQKHFVYSSFGRRDPFVPVKLPEVEGISIDDVRLVGIIWDAKDPIAIFEDQKVPERNYSLRAGDAVLNGMVKKITPNGVIFTLNDFGVIRQYSMTLPKEQK